MKTPAQWIQKILISTNNDVIDQIKRQEHVNNILLRIPRAVYQHIEDAYHGTYAHVVLYIPWNEQAESAVLEAMDESGWEITGTHYYEREGQFKIEFNHPDLGNTSTFWNDVTIYKMPNLPGSTCHKVPAGTIEIEVYEMQCNETE